MLPFVIKAIISENVGLPGDHTIYLFNQEQKIVLPIKVTQGAINSLLLAQEGKHALRPHIHNTTQRLISALNGEVQRVIINGYNDEVFYAYIRVAQNNKTFDIDAKPSDALSIALRTKSPIYASKKIVKEIGIKVTPEMLS